MSRFLRLARLTNTVATSFRPVTVNRGFVSAARMYSSENVGIAEIKDIATGEQAAELEALEKGVDIYDRRVLTGAFGTKEKPFVVPSQNAERVVGCQGGGDNVHDIAWMIVDTAGLHGCGICGQVFKLDGQAHH